MNQRCRLLDNGWLELHTQVGRNIEHRELSIYIGVDYAQDVNAHESKGTHVAITAIAVFAVFEDGFEAFFLPRDIVVGGKHIQIRLCVWVVVHNVQIGLRIVAVHLLVPHEGVSTTQETTVEDRQFPVFAVVYLSCAGQYYGEPECLLWILDTQVPTRGRA